ncbi:hypothetical protein V6N11_073267 [Hibiscus sabdariffa]|uniref:Uncharacterized protein n=2 Tax=Hibiscus sabdariffa TaxID=183260 RepID=A0ABR2B4Q7_9ROSI
MVLHRRRGNYTPGRVPGNKGPIKGCDHLRRRKHQQRGAGISSVQTPQSCGGGSRGNAAPSVGGEPLRFRLGAREREWRNGGREGSGYHRLQPEKSAAFMVPKKVKFLWQLSKTSTGKIQKFQLRALAESFQVTEKKIRQDKKEIPEYHGHGHGHGEQILAMSRL